ncbi:hypothetical protein [Flavonifractor sp. An306]|uniref:hypothetical protein n=1 Tax=Flavonifractor sp. An306 TaxID=1965629 RepID=UPI000B38F49F|nr:hypothetical protein [Flavonifractor sp. An306]OUO37941.1 hypothetical protein B5F88_12045 [Flavonifractor sp. An306]
MNKELYFKELGIALGRSGFTSMPERDGSLPVEYESRPLCRVDAGGSVFYNQDDVNTLERESACRRVTYSAAIVLEYMTLLAQAPVLHAAGLNEPYRVLAEFNGTVLAGWQTGHGAKFVTWDWDFNHAGLNQGHYYEGNYSEAKGDFAVRSGLVPREQQFTPEQLSPGDYQGYLYCYDKQQQELAHQVKLVGRVTYADGTKQEFTDPQQYLRTIREELP